jgi:hypothetical protein
MHLYAISPFFSTRAQPQNFFDLPLSLFAIQGKNRGIYAHDVRLFLRKFLFG